MSVQVGCQPDQSPSQALVARWCARMGRGAPPASALVSQSRGRAALYVEASEIEEVVEAGDEETAATGWRLPTN